MTTEVSPSLRWGGGGAVEPTWRATSPPTPHQTEYLAAKPYQGCPPTHQQHPQPSNQKQVKQTSSPMTKAQITGTAALKIRKSEL